MQCGLVVRRRIRSPREHPASHRSAGSESRNLGCLGECVGVRALVGLEQVVSSAAFVD